MSSSSCCELTVLGSLLAGASPSLPGLPPAAATRRENSASVSRARSEPYRLGMRESCESDLNSASDHFWRDGGRESQASRTDSG